jgi:hypothetical protein
MIRMPMLVAAVLLLAGGLSGVRSPLAATSAYQRRWWTVDGGGGIPSADTSHVYRLGGTIGQHDAYVMNGGVYRVRGGFWSFAPGLGYVGVGPDPAALPSAFRALSPSPNPARAASTIAFELPRACEVSVRIRDVQGRLVRELDHSRRVPGRQALAWDGRDDRGARAPRGLYFIHIDAGQDHGVAKLVLLTDGGAR